LLFCAHRRQAQRPPNRYLRKTENDMDQSRDLRFVMDDDVVLRRGVDARGDGQLGQDDLRVITVMQILGHGRIENGLVRRGSPVLAGRTRIFQLMKNTKASHRQTPHKPWAARKPHSRHYRFIEACRQVKLGVIEKIDIADGLPMNWKLRRSKPHSGN